MKRLRAAFLWICLCVDGSAQMGPPEIFRISPTSGPEGTRVEITGRNLRSGSTVFFGTASATFKLLSEENIVAIVPHKSEMALVTVVTPQGRASSPFAFAVLNDPRIPDEVSYKAGYVNPAGRPVDFHSVMLWGIAIADTRVPGYESASVEVASVRLSCRIDSKDVVLINDSGRIHGGLYRRIPWFQGNQPEPMPMASDAANNAVVLAVGKRGDRIWHFWSASPRPALPAGKLEGCTVQARVRISPGALLQMGMDYWRDPTVPFSSGGNNHEAGASNWYFPSDQWQEAVFTDINSP